MSLSTSAVQIIDPRMRVNNERIQAISIGPKNNTYRKITADSGQNVSTVNFNYNATSVNDIIDRQFYVKYYLQIVITGTGNPLTNHGVSDSLRFLPINSSCTSLQLTINNSSVTTIPFQWLDALSRYIPAKVLAEDLSGSPSQTDLFYDYTLATGPKNVCGDYTDNSINSPDLRGSIVPVSITEGNGTSTLQFEITEPLFCPPLNYSGCNDSGFIGVENLSVQLSHSWTGGNTWSHAGSEVLSAFTFTMYNTPELLLNIMSPNELVEPFDPSKNYVYNMSALRHYSTSAGTLASGSSLTVNSSNIQLNCIPSLVYVFARKIKTSRLSTEPDTFLRLTSLSVSMGNKTGLLSNANSYELFKIAKKNGYQYSYNAWRDFQGSVLCLKPSEDLSLDLGEAPGLIVQKQLQVNATLLNQTSASVNFELVIVPVLPGAFIINNGLSSQSIGLLSPEQILNAPMVSDLQYAQYQNMDVYGSGLFDWIKKIAGEALPIIGPKLVDWGEKQLMRGVDYLGKKARERLQQQKGGYIMGGENGGFIMGGAYDDEEDHEEYNPREEYKNVFKRYD